MSTALKAAILVCTLSPSPTESSSELLARQLAEQLQSHSVHSHLCRIADYTVHFGVKTDMENGDEWPEIRESILNADIVIIATPIWMGQPSAITKLILERLNAELSETGPDGAPTMYGKVAAAVIVGNEDGAHHTSAEIYQAMSDVGFTIPAGGPAYWVGEAMGSADYKDLTAQPEKTAETLRTLAANAAHLARVLKERPYPTP